MEKYIRKPEVKSRFRWTPRETRWSSGEKRRVRPFKFVGMEMFASEELWEIVPREERVAGTNVSL